MGRWRESRLLEKVAIDPGYDSGSRAGPPSIPSLFSRKFGDQNPAVSQYNRAVATPTPLDPYIKQYGAKGPTIGETGSQQSASPTAQSVATTEQNFYKTLGGNFDRRIRDTASKYDQSGMPLSGMRSTTPGLIQKGYQRAGLYRPDISPSPEMRGYSKALATREPPVGDVSVYDLGNGRTAMGPVNRDTALNRLADRSGAMSDRFQAAKQKSLPVLDVRYAGETDPFVQATPTQRFGAAVARRLPRSNPSAAQKFQSTQDAVVEQVKRNLPSFLGGRTEQGIQADRVVREAKRQSPGGYWLDNALKVLPGTYGSIMPNPLALADLVGNAVEGVERPFRNAANRNYLERLYGRGSAQASDQATTLRSMQRYQEQGERAQAAKQRVLGPVDNYLPLSMIPVPFIDSPASAAAGLFPLARLGERARGAALVGQFMGSPFGIGSTFTQGLVPRPGQAGRQYARELVPNVAPDVAMGLVSPREGDVGLQSAARNASYGDYGRRLERTLRNR